MDREKELDNLVTKIFEVIPSYYDAGEASEIKQLILEYIEKHYEKTTTV